MAITVRMADGRVARQEAGVPLGAPANAMSTAQRAAKFLECAANAVRPVPPDAAQAALVGLARLETLADARAAWDGLLDGQPDGYAAT